jgi:hypothetical protein
VSSTDKSLVIGILTTMPPSFIEPFSGSLRRTGFKGRFCVVTAGYPRPALDQLAQLADDVYRVDDTVNQVPASRAIPALALTRRTRGLRRFYPYLFETAARFGSERRSLARWQSLEFHLEGLQALRYAHYLRYLQTHGADADFVMLTDLRDVVFQDDPFRNGVEGLELYLEEDHLRIGTDHFNTLWLRKLYGVSTVTALGGTPISCSGTVVGTADAIRRYLTEMVSEIVWRRRPLGALDQGVHNWLIAQGRLPHATLVPNGTGRVLTMGGMASYRTAPDGMILNADGSVPAVVHQFDRHPELAARLTRPR